MESQHTTPILAETIVTEWYRRWTGRARTPTERELRQASAMIDDYGADVALGVVPHLVAIMRSAWPDAVRFGSVQAYLNDAVRQYTVEQRAAERRRDAVRARESSVLPSDLGRVWDGLPELVQYRIREYVLRRHPTILGKEALIRDACISAMVNPGLSNFYFGGGKE